MAIFKSKYKGDPSRYADIYERGRDYLKRNGVDVEAILEETTLDEFWEGSSYSQLKQKYKEKLEDTTVDGKSMKFAGAILADDAVDDVVGESLKVDEPDKKKAWDNRQLVTAYLENRVGDPDWEKFPQNNPELVEPLNKMLDERSFTPQEMERYFAIKVEHKRFLERHKIKRNPDTGEVISTPESHELLERDTGERLPIPQDLTKLFQVYQRVDDRTEEEKAQKVPLRYKNVTFLEAMAREELIDPKTNERFTIPIGLIREEGKPDRLEPNYTREWKEGITYDKAIKEGLLQVTQIPEENRLLRTVPIEPKEYYVSRDIKHAREIKGLFDKNLPIYDKRNYIERKIGKEKKIPTTASLDEIMKSEEKLVEDVQEVLAKTSIQSITRTLYTDDNGRYLSPKDIATGNYKHLNTASGQINAEQFRERLIAAGMRPNWVDKIFKVEEDKLVLKKGEGNRIFNESISPKVQHILRDKDNNIYRVKDYFTKGTDGKWTPNNKMLTLYKDDPVFKALKDKIELPKNAKPNMGLRVNLQDVPGPIKRVSFDDRTPKRLSAIENKIATTKARYEVVEKAVGTGLRLSGPDLRKLEKDAAKKKDEDLAAYRRPPIVIQNFFFPADPMKDKPVLKKTVDTALREGRVKFAEARYDADPAIFKAKPIGNKEEKLRIGDKLVILTPGSKEKPKPGEKGVQVNKDIPKGLTPGDVFTLSGKTVIKVEEVDITQDKVRALRGKIEGMQKKTTKELEKKSNEGLYGDIGIGPGNNPYLEGHQINRGEEQRKAFLRAIQDGEISTEEARKFIKSRDIMPQKVEKYLSMEIGKLEKAEGKRLERERKAAEKKAADAQKLRARIEAEERRIQSEEEKFRADVEAGYALRQGEREERLSEEQEAYLRGEILETEEAGRQQRIVSTLAGPLERYDALKLPTRLQQRYRRLMAEREKVARERGQLVEIVEPEKVTEGLGRRAKAAPGEEPSKGLEKPVKTKPLSKEEREAQEQIVKTTGNTVYIPQFSKDPDIQRNTKLYGGLRDANQISDRLLRLKIDLADAPLKEHPKVVEMNRAELGTLEKYFSPSWEKTIKKERTPLLSPEELSELDRRKFQRR